jgi:hypothetical protein
MEQHTKWLKNIMPKLTAVAYYKGIPPNNTNLEKPLILDNFIQGVNAVGDIGISHRQMTTIDCDVALIQGFVHESGKDSPHLVLRKKAIDLQKQNNKKSLIVDSNLFLYADPGNSKRYLRYSFNGVFPTTGFYFDQDVDSNRWKKIKNNLNIDLKPYRQHGSHVLICLQRNGGWSMQGLSAVSWLDSTITKLKQYTDRHIVVRTHPNDRKIKNILKIKHENVSLSRNESLVQDLKYAWATIVYNSSPSVASVIEGVPTFVTDPDPRTSQSFSVSNTDLSQIENPVLHERQAWIERLSMCHWNFDELKSGEAWSFFRQYV